jgi:hypothetical protein
MVASTAEKNPSTSRSTTTQRRDIVASTMFFTAE